MPPGKCRRLTSITALAACVLLVALAVAPATTFAFGFYDVARRAKALAAKPHAKPAPKLPKELSALTYEQYRDIRYKSERFHWRGAGLPFELGFFHAGFYFDQPVK